jgi:hypothetical protein
MRGIEEIPPRMPLTLELRKPPKSSPFAHEFGRGIKGEKPQRVQAYIPYQIPKRKASESLQENHQERASKITEKEKRERHIQALRNRVESSIHTKEVHTRSSLPLGHPSLSQDRTMKLSS